MSDKLTEKDIYSLAGQVDAACIIMHDAMMQMVSGRWKFSEEAVKAVMDATKLAESLRVALRKVSYEVENVREDPRDHK